MAVALIIREERALPPDTPETGAVGTPTEQLGALFQAHQHRVLRAAYRVTGSMADAEDVAQAVFLRLLQHSKSGHDGGPAGNIDHAESYLYRAAINGSLDLLRRRKLEAAAPLEAALDRASRDPGTSPERNCSEAELRSWLRLALSRMGPRAAEMFVLRYLEDLSNREIARLLNTSQALVGVVLYRARARLRRELKNFMRGEL